DARRGLCYGRNDGETGGVETNPIHLTQAAKLSHQAGPPLYQENGNFEFVLPCEGSIRVPYVMRLVATAPHQESAQKVLDFVVSDAGQAIWTNAYLKPSRPVELPAEVSARFLPDSDYERAVALDYAEMEKAQARFSERYLSEVK